MTSIHKRIVYERTGNGADIYMVKTPTKDVVVCKIALPGGHFMSYDNPSASALLGRMIPGSTTRHKRTPLLNEFGALGATWSFEVSNTRMFVELACRSEVFTHVFRMLTASLATLVLPEAEYREAYTGYLTDIRDNREDTSIQAQGALMRALYRRGHPHWQETSDEFLLDAEKTERSDVVRFWKDTLSAVGAVVTVAGDIKPDAFMPEVRDALELLPGRAPVREVTVAVDHTNTPADMDRTFSMKEKMNVDTYLGIPLSLTRDSEDFLALSVAVQVLGGGATGRLFHTLRTKQSLTYGAGASLVGFADGYPGLVRAYAIFPHDVYAKGLPVLRQTVRTFVEKGITASELRARKEEVAGKHKVGLSSTGSVCAALLSTVLAGKPLEYIDVYPELVNGLTLRKVNDAIARHVDYRLAVSSAAGAIDTSGKPLA